MRDSDPKISPEECQRALVEAAWLEHRVTRQVNGLAGPDEHWSGVEGWFRRDELGLQAGETSIFHTLENLAAINKKNRAELARREGQGPTADKKRVRARAPRDRHSRDKDTRRLMRSAGLKISAGTVTRAK